MAKPANMQRMSLAMFAQSVAVIGAPGKLKIDLLIALVALFRFPRENAAADYKCGHGCKEQSKLHQWRHRSVSVALTLPPAL
jgi:hypothetical protein